MSGKPAVRFRSDSRLRWRCNVGFRDKPSDRPTLADGFFVEGVMNPVVKVALAGISGYGDLYLESLLHDPRGNGVQLVGVVDPMPQRCRRLAELHERKIPVFPNLQTLFPRFQVDLMMIVTPIHVHAPQTSAMPVAVQAELYRANEIENYDTAAIRAVADCGTEILFYTTHAVQDRKGPVMRFEFERAVVEFDASGSGQFVARYHDGRMKSFGQPNLDRHEKIWQSIDSVRTGRPVACDVNAAMAHTCCVMAAQKSSTILDFPLRLRQTIEMEGEPMICVDGLYEALIECYEHGVLPAGLGKCDWARAGNVIDLEKAL